MIKMSKLDRKNEFLETTMKIISESGLDNFAMKKVTLRMGVSESLLYKYYPTKEELLYSCFESVHKEIGGLFQETKFPMIESREELVHVVHDIWKKYFMFLVKNDYKTIFYFEYRDSLYMRQAIAHDSEARNSYFLYFVNILKEIDNYCNVQISTASSVLWTYILDTSGIFAKRMIRKDIPMNNKTIEQIWGLLAFGLVGLLKES